MVVWKLQLDRAEAGGSRRAEALEQRALGEEIGQIGSEARHEKDLAMGMRSALPAYRCIERRVYRSRESIPCPPTTASTSPSCPATASGRKSWRRRSRC